MSTRQSSYENMLLYDGRPRSWPAGWLCSFLSKTPSLVVLTHATLQIGNAHTWMCLPMRSWYVSTMEYVTSEVNRSMVEFSNVSRSELGHLLHVSWSQLSIRMFPMVGRFIHSRRSSRSLLCGDLSASDSL